ncbi:DeoR/GlpR family DNA-binding transcription regulator [Aquibacillus rhizosphaerae]|uniref:DeoR/GlpR family DNA-binding transcription regulator n=1 Tax=Aquibacillus rhizosphaerae TaxID=3051431 RepID=A0ABT7L1A4_9BACI|nr:DeoR/GlpR family DNA-binding transcription regulator [Aquibacillus sp. LR5S19]MDL4839593.1 DeoR/GlpR family DNA-binding transcription regulator [Aquibacillus sp. LR5S19]
MLVAERQQKIVELVNDRKSIRVTELSSIFSVTEETIRRDLEKLENDEKLLRSHGGAIRITKPNDSMEIPYSEREITNVLEKKEISLEAIKLVVEEDKIILDASTTAWYMAKALPDIPMTVLTNSIKVAMELSVKKQITVISTGGTLSPKSLSYVGPLAEMSLESYHVNKAFISCKGLHLERGISESDEQQARIKKKMIDSADSVYIMVDHSKIGLQSFARLNGLDVIDCIITDSKIDPRTMKQLTDRSLKLIKV